MIKEMSSELFDLEFENEHGFRILKYHNPEEYLENERFLSFFDTGHVSGWVAMHIRPDEYSKLTLDDSKSRTTLLIRFPSCRIPPLRERAH